MSYDKNIRKTLVCSSITPSNISLSKPSKISYKRISATLTFERHQFRKLTDALAVSATRKGSKEIAIYFTENIKFYSKLSFKVTLQTCLGTNFNQLTLF